MIWSVQLRASATAYVEAETEAEARNKIGAAFEGTGGGGLVADLGDGAPVRRALWVDSDVTVFPPDAGVPFEREGF